jgi:hypothetical protein
VQQVLELNPHGGDLFVFRGKRGDLLKVLWNDGIGMSLYAKRLERGRFIWPAPVGGVVPISSAQLAYLLEASTGACHNTHGDRRRRDSCDRLNRRASSSPQSAAFVVLLQAMTSVDALPDDAESLKRLLLAREAELAAVAAEAATLRAKAADDQALIAHLKLQIEKLRRERFGQRSERSARLLDQLELQLEELETSATEDELEAERAAAKTTKVAAFTACAQALPRAPATRAGDRARPDRLPLLRRHAPVEAG